MKKKISLSVIMFTLIILILNLPVTTRQGVNYKVQALRIPLYLKVLDFYDRHFNYKLLVARITAGKKTDDARIMAIFNWTFKNILPQPKGLLVKDDHVWHIIVRGYGTGDQFADVFATLCNYAGYKAMFLRLQNAKDNSKITVAFLRLKRQWHIFDPATGAYFVNNSGGFATTKDILSGNWQVRKLDDSGINLPDYAAYFTGLDKIDLEETQRFSRPNLQSPFNRMLYAVKKAVFR